MLSTVSGLHAVQVTDRIASGQKHANRESFLLRSGHQIAYLYFSIVNEPGIEIFLDSYLKTSRKRLLDNQLWLCLLSASSSSPGSIV